MKFSRYGITFHLLKEMDIELVRQWRNDPVVAGNFEFRDHITSEMQKEWFSSVNNICNLYTIIEFEGKKIGVVSIKNIDWDSRIGEGGIFLPDPSYHNTFLPAMISYITTEIIFVMFEWNVGYAHVLKANTKVKEFVRMLGYELLPGQEKVNNQLYRITRETFAKRAPRIKKAISVVAGREENGVLCIERSEVTDPLVLQWEDKVKTGLYIATVESTAEGRCYYFSGPK